MNELKVSVSFNKINVTQYTLDWIIYQPLHDREIPIIDLQSQITS